MLRKSFLIFISFGLAGWFIFDALYFMQTGYFFGSNEPGKWADVLRAASISPSSFAPALLALGCLWLTSAFATLAHHSWWQPFLVSTAILTLWYIPFGTGLSLMSIVLVLGQTMPRPYQRKLITGIGGVLAAGVAIVLNLRIS
jgi:hypothetical protein